MNLFMCPARSLMALRFAFALGCLIGWLPFPAAACLEDRLAPEPEDLQAILTPDAPPEVAPPPAEGPVIEPMAFGAFASSVQQQQGALSGKIVFMNSGHGWTYDPSYWRLQRPVLYEMNEDYGNLDQLNFFAQYCFNAGATVVSFRPLGHQTNEIILDNDDPGVTFSGSWTNSASTIFWGSAGDVPYRHTGLAASETATATYTPTFPAAGFYPVYTWVRHGSDRGDQLYRIRHTGGESWVRVPHHRVGNGWIYLGEYYFNAGSNAAAGSVVISNLRGTPTGSVIIADAIRFGNGMGTVNRGGGVSGYPREDESMRYWLQANLGQGQSTALYDGSGGDESDSWSAPPKMSAEMNRQQDGDIFDRIHISFHSNAGGGRGVVALITSDPTPYQAQLAQIVGKEVNDDLVALGSPPLEVPWFNRTTVTYSGGYSEIDGSLFNYEMAATIVEVAFHDSSLDALLLRDPKARAAVARATLHGVIKFMNTYDTNDPPPLAFLPEPPTSVRAIALSNGWIHLAWVPPVSSGGSQAATNYILYRSTNGYGFGQPVAVGNVTNTIVTNLPAGTDYYFRVTAVNPGGESMPSETVGCRAATTNNAPRVLVVNAYDRLDRMNNLRHDVVAQSYDPPGNSGSIERVYARWNNAFDYVVTHGKAITAAGWAFDSCQNEDVATDRVALSNYAVVIWACGNESTADETFSAVEQTRVAAYLAAGGALFASGSDIAWDLDRPSGPTSADRDFLRNQLRVAYSADNSSNYTVVASSAGIFAGRPNGTFDNGNNGIYWVKTPDVLTPMAPAMTALTYSNGGAAAVQYDGSAGGGRTVVFGFPFETITSAARRHEFMADILAFLTLQSTTPTIPAAPSGLTATAVSASQINLSWTDNAPNETGFKIERAPLPGGPWSQIATVSSNVTTYASTGLLNSSTYFFRVRASNTAGDSPYSNLAQATTANAAPALTPIANRSLNEGSTLLLTNAATDTSLGVTTVLADFETFPSGTANGSVMFRQPSFSGTTSGFLDPSPNTSSVTDSVPTGNPSTRVLNVNWSFTNSAVNPWLRLTTFNAANLPNPTVSFQQRLRFDIRADKSLKVALGLRETSTTAPLGADGGTTGTIEFAGVSGKTGNTPIPTRTIPANTWTNLEFDLPNEPLASLTGNGLLESTTGKGVLEHLALVPNAGNGAYNVHLDNFTQTQPHRLTFSLDAGAPAGASIDPQTGVFSWTPTEAQGPGSYAITVRVTDNGTPPLSATQTFTVTVHEVNLPPVLAAIADRTVNAGATLAFTNSATDPDLPPNTLSFSLDAAPPGAAIGPSNGVFSWTAPPTSVPLTNTVTVRVTDNGTPPLSDTKSFTLVVVPPPRFGSVATVGNDLVLTWQTFPGKRYRVEYKDELSAPVWTPLGVEQVASGWTLSVTNSLDAAPQRFFRIVQVD